MLHKIHYMSETKSWLFSLYYVTLPFHEFHEKLSVKMVHKIYYMSETQYWLFSFYYLTIEYSEKIIGQNVTQNPLHEWN